MAAGPFIRKARAPIVAALSISICSAMARSMTSSLMQAPRSGVALRIPAATGDAYQALWYPQRDEDAPLVLYLHAGLFTRAPAGDRPTVVEQLLLQAGAAVVSLRYPLAPAHPFPQAVCAAYAALQYLGHDRGRLAGVRAGLLVAGAEAGGNLAAGVAMKARDRNELHLLGQILVSPMLDPLLATHSLRSAGAGIAGCKLAEGWRQYAARPGDAVHPYADPANAVRLEGLPRALLFTADDDPFRDETRAYARRLREHHNDPELVTLRAPTRFPAAYMEAAAADAPWTAVARESLRSFLAAVQQAGPV
jgi:acetyl esterase/lipase